MFLFTLFSEILRTLVSELFVQILASGLGALSLVWGTVVLLGGFSTSLQMADFWVITAIVFIQTARVVGINVSPEAEFFNQVPPAFLEMGTEHYTTWGRRRPLTGEATGQNFVYSLMLALGSARDFLAITAILAIFVLAVPMIAGLACISLSIYRLVVLLSRHHDISNVFRAQVLFYSLVLLQGITAILAILVLAVPMIAGLACISLSIYCLVVLLSRHHDISNVFRAQVLFYSLVLLQGGLFIIWLFLRLYRSYLANSVSLKYGLEDKRKLIHRYMDKTLSTAIKNGVSSTINRNLASFAVDLIKSDYSQDHTEAVLLIHTLTSQEDHRTKTVSQIQSSPLCVSRLLDMVTSKSRTDHTIKICIAEIVAHLASNLCLADISGATESISSMIDPYFTKISTPATNVNIDHQTAIDITIDQQAINTASANNGGENLGFCISVKKFVKWVLALQRAEIIRNRQQRTLRLARTTGGGESKPLIIHGLLILAKLAVNTDNCKQIYEYKGLFSKIISPIKNKVYEIHRDDGIPMEIIEKALEVVSMLVSGTDEINGKIRRDICSNGMAVNDIRLILERSPRYNKLKVPATKILTELSLDVSTQATLGIDAVAEFIKVLMDIFFDAANEIELRQTAGEALAVLAMDNANCMTMMNFNTGRTEASVQLLTDMIPAANDGPYQTAIAQLLMQFCANSDSNAERENLTSVKVILHEVLKVVCDLEQAANVNQQAANANQAGSPQDNGVLHLLLTRAFPRLTSLLRRRISDAANRTVPDSPQQNLGQRQAANTNQTGSPQHSPGQPQAANNHQTGSPQHNPGRPPFSRALHRLNSLLGAHHTHGANRNAPIDNLPAAAYLLDGRIKCLATFLGLVFQICNKLEISADDFDNALVHISLSMGEFVDKLNYIIDQCKGHSGYSLEGQGTSVEYLRIIKTVTKLCTWMMQSNPDYVTEFQNKNTSTKLQGALEDMRDLELGVLLTGSAGDVANYETLSSIMDVARQLMDANVQV